MTKFQQKFATAFATGAVLLNALAPMASAATITITGNGSNSDNDAKVETSNDVDVDQSNDAHVDNNIKVFSETGNNSASDNTGGDVKVDTGDSTVLVDVENKLNSNWADVESCCPNDTDVKIEGNGTGSDNNAKLKFDNDVDVDQDNDAHVKNKVDVESETGDNSADDNTGGDVTVKTGDSTVKTYITNEANYNSAKIGSKNGDGGSVSALIKGNGSNSDNDVDFDFNNDVNLDQDNDAHFDNNVDLESDTDDNTADDNTGGDVLVDTGDSTLTVVLDNMANFNWADVEACGCLEDLEGKIAGNGTESDSEITFDTDNDLDVDQDNDSKFNNKVDGELETGDNSADDNTSWEGGDPTVKTGDAKAGVKASNSGNMNVYGDSADLGDDLDVDLDFTFDLGDLLDWLMGHQGN